MTVYVDQLFYWPNVSAEAKRRGHARKKWCHMFGDNEEELHVLAKRIGLKRAWFQNSKWPHYDLTESKRTLAIKHGARQVVSTKEMIKIRKEMEG